MSNIPKDRKAIDLLIKRLGLADIWRLVNPFKKEYTLYLYNDKSHSRIAYLFMLNDPTEGVMNCKIGATAVTDQATVQVW